MNFEHQYNTVQQPLRETPLISIHRMLIQSQSHDQGQCHWGVLCAGVQLQQPGDQPEGMSCVHEE